MRTLRSRSVAALLAVLALCSACASAGGAAREQALVPALAQAWPAVRDNLARGAVEQGVDASGAIAQWESAFAVSDQDALVMLRDQTWADVRALAVLGVDARMQAGEIGPGVAASFLERINRFGSSLEMLR